MTTTFASTSMAGKVCLITGATSGIGKVTATALAAQGARVVISGRNPAKTSETASRIRAETGNEDVQHLLADHSDLDQVSGMAAGFKDRFDRLDVLINNAGTFSNVRRLESNGVEMTFYVNQLAPFLLTISLLDTLQASGNARILNVSSEAHKYGTLDLNDLSYARRFVGMKAYARSKLAIILFTYELARRLDGSQVTVNALHPGHIATDMWKTPFPLIGPLLKPIMGLFALTPEQGADNSIWLASSPEVEGVTGRYFIERDAAPSSPQSYDEDLARELWQISEELTLKTTPDDRSSEPDVSNRQSMDDVAP